MPRWPRGCWLQPSWAIQVPLSAAHLEGTADRRWHGLRRQHFIPRCAGLSQPQTRCVIRGPGRGRLRAGCAEGRGSQPSARTRYLPLHPLWALRCGAHRFSHDAGLARNLVRRRRRAASTTVLAHDFRDRPRIARHGDAMPGGLSAEHGLAQPVLPTRGQPARRRIQATQWPSEHCSCNCPLAPSGRFLSLHQRHLHDCGFLALAEGDPGGRGGEERHWRKAARGAAGCRLGAASQRDHDGPACLRHCWFPRHSHLFSAAVLPADTQAPDGRAYFRG
mmetsp:Transcript_63156/g.148350  ORF Transcript_63156/g.148350 Transcript_63156/m.148350 type:complete len:277 (+) Transcript_63156:400-1230(+)